MNLILLGPPGSGKGTQAAIISERYGIPAISTGDIIRATTKGQTALGEKVRGFIDKGELVPDELVIELVKERLSADDCNNGYILDGFPRTVAQAEAITNMGIRIDRVIDIHLADNLIVSRISGRRVCPNCGASYHITASPSKDGVNCDKCNTALVQRNDDEASVVQKRLKVYEEKTAPLTDYYQARGLISKISSADTIESVSKDIFDILEAMA